MSTLILLRSPEDCFVESVVVPLGTVSQDETLGILKSFQVERFARLLDFTFTQLEMAERIFTDGRKADENKVSSLTTENLHNAAIAWAGVADVAKANYELGQVAADFVSATAETQAQASLQAIIAANKADNMAFKTEDTRDHHRAARVFLEEAKRILEDVAKRLTLRSPAAGRFVASAAAGCFLKKGQTFGTIEVV